MTGVRENSLSGFVHCEGVVIDSPVDDPAEEHYTHPLDPACGGPGTAIREHEHEQGKLTQQAYTVIQL
jgi:hypothetical protein